MSAFPPLRVSRLDQGKLGFRQTVRRNETLDPIRFEALGSRQAFEVGDDSPELVGGSRPPEVPTEAVLSTSEAIRLRTFSGAFAYRILQSGTDPTILADGILVALLHETGGFEIQLDKRLIVEEGSIVLARVFEASCHQPVQSGLFVSRFQERFRLFAESAILGETRREALEHHVA